MSTASDFLPEMDTVTPRSEFAARLGACCDEVLRRAGGSFALSTQTGLATKRLNRLLAGAEPTLSEVSSMAKAFGVTPEWLVFGTGRQNGKYVNSAEFREIPVMEWQPSDPRRIWGYIRNDSLASFPFCPEGTLEAYFISAGIIRPRYEYAEWLLVDVSQTELQTGGILILEYLGGKGLHVHEVTISPGGMVTFDEGRGGAAEWEKATMPLTAFREKMGVRGRALCILRRP